MKKLSLFALVVICVSSFGIMSCHKDNNTKPPTTLTLYDSLGGTTMVQDPTAAPGTMIEKGRLGIRSVVDSTIFVIAADNSINGYFTVLLQEVTNGNLTGFEELSKNLTDFFAVATGAKDYMYTGLSMTAAHNPSKNAADTITANPRISMKVDAADFNEFITDLGKGATKVGLPTYLIARVATVASSVQGQVVQR